MADSDFHEICERCGNSVDLNQCICHEKETIALAKMADEFYADKIIKMFDDIEKIKVRLDGDDSPTELGKLASIQLCKERHLSTFQKDRKYNLLNPEDMKSHFKEVVLPMLEDLKLSCEEKKMDKLTLMIRIQTGIFEHIKNYAKNTKMTSKQVEDWLYDFKGFWWQEIEYAIKETIKEFGGIYDLKGSDGGDIIVFPKKEWLELMGLQ